MANGTDAVVARPTMGTEGLSFAVVDSPRIGQPILRPVFDYWEQKRGSRAMPMRHDIEPADLKAYLPHLSLVEPLPDGAFRYRLVGSAITERYGRNSTGKTLQEIYADKPAIVGWMSRVMLAVTIERRPVLATGTLGAVGKDHILSEALLLPLSDDGVNVTMIFGATRYSTRPPATPPAA